MNYECFAVKSIGSSHIEKGSVCQDSVQLIKMLERATVSAADGHGGQIYFRSDRGSDYAANIACEKINDFLEKSEYENQDEKHQKDLIHDLIMNIIDEWKLSVRTDILKNRFSDEELELVNDCDIKDYIIFSQKNLKPDDIDDLDDKLQTVESNIYKAYGTTLLSIGIAEKYAIAIHIGDGKCVAIYDDGSMDEPIPWDEKCHLNNCTSICDRNAYEEFRYYVWKDKIPVAAFIATDGIDDTFADRLHAFYTSIALDFIQSDYKTCINKLNDMLPNISATGSHDDVSVAGVIDEVRLKAVSDVLQSKLNKDNQAFEIKKYQDAIIELDYKLKTKINKRDSYKAEVQKILDSYDEEINQLKSEKEIIEEKLSGLTDWFY